MRILLVGAAALALSGCSWLKGSGHNDYKSTKHGHYQSTSDDCCVGGKTLSRWNLEGAIGPSFLVGGDAITGEDINPIPGTAAQNISMKDVYDPGVRYELGGSYALNPNRKVTLLGNYTSYEGDDVNLGTIDGETVSGTMGDYDSYGVEAGLRQYFKPRAFPVVKSLRPYVEGRIGAQHVDDIALEGATITNGANPAQPWLGGDVGFYEGGWVGTGAGLVGVEAPIFKRATLGLETGIRYTGGLKTDTTDLGPGVPLAGTNNGSDNWSVPVMLRGRYRF